jgi:ribosomal protein S18 acetylase RimI-like enzyme
MSGPAPYLRFASTVEVVIRDAREADLAALEWFGAFTPHRQIIAEAFASHERGEGRVLVAEVGGFPAGQAWIDFRGGTSPAAALIWALRVLEPLQGLGVAQALLDIAERLIAERGFALAEIGVEKDNEAAFALYERLGYRVLTERQDAYVYTPPGGAPVTAVADQWILAKRLAVPAQAGASPTRA